MRGNGALIGTATPVSHERYPMNGENGVMKIPVLTVVSGPPRCR